MPNISGSPTQAQTFFLNPSDLANFDDSQSDSGDMAWVQSLGVSGELFVLNKSVTIAPDNIKYIATKSGLGTWVELSVFSTSGGTLLTDPFPYIKNDGYNTGAMGILDTQKAVYDTGIKTVAFTENASMVSSQCIGFYSGTPGTIILLGVLPAAQFTTVGGLPTNGQQIYLASAGDEAGGNGKLTPIVPSVLGTVAAPVGKVIDNSNWAALKTCRVVIAIESPVQL